MRRIGLSGLLVWVAAVATVAGCDSLSKEECLKVRGEAFDIVNEAHTCNDDADCLATEWPGCAKPINNKNQDRITPLKEKFDKGKCEDEKNTCPEVPLMYCKQGLCVSKHEAGEAGNPAKK